MRQKQILAELDALRTQLRAEFQSDQSVPKSSVVLQRLSKLVTAMKADILDEERQLVETVSLPPSAGEPGSGPSIDYDPSKPPTLTPIPREPVPVHTINVEVADEKTLADAALFATVPD